MANIVLLNQNGNPVTYEGAKQIKVPNADGGETTYTNMEELHPYFVTFVGGSGSKTVKIVSYGFYSRYANAVVSLGSYVDEEGNTCLPLLTTNGNLETGKTYNLGEL